MSDFSAMVAYGVGTMILRHMALSFIAGLAIGTATSWYFL